MPQTLMIDSLRDQLLNLGFKAPEPQRKPGNKPGAGKGRPGQDPSSPRRHGSGDSRPSQARTPESSPRENDGRKAGPGHAKPGHGRPDHARNAGRGDGPRHGGRAGPRKPASEMDLGKAWAMRSQQEKQERIAAEQAKQEQARLRREAKAELEALLQGQALNDADAQIARHFEYGGKIKRIYVNEAQLKALNAGELGVLQSNGRYLLVEAALLAQAEAVFAPAVALKVDPTAPAQDDPYADPRYQVPDDLVW